MEGIYIFYKNEVLILKTIRKNYDQIKLKSVYYLVQNRQERVMLGPNARESFQVSSDLQILKDTTYIMKNA